MSRLWPIPLICMLLSTGCGKEIGDDCALNFDCAQDGTRDCDLSQPGGYCTIAGCDEVSCPEEAVCIRFFPYQFATLPCRSDADCGAESLCLPDGLCVPRTSERRFCERTCGGNGDCRGGYECRTAGMTGVPISNSYGTLALVRESLQSRVIRFCAPRP